MFEALKKKLKEVNKKKYINKFIDKYKNTNFDFFGYISDFTCPVFSFINKVDYNKDGNSMSFGEFVYPYFPEILFFCTERLDRNYTNDFSENDFKELCDDVSKCFNWDKTESKKTINKCVEIFNKIKNGEELDEEKEMK